MVPTPEGPEGAIICAREAVPKADRLIRVRSENEYF
jgi:hypothetical protein